MQITNLKTLYSVLKCELKENYMMKSRVVIFLLRVSNYGANQPLPIMLVFTPFFLLYIFFVEWVLAIEIPIKTSIGKGLVIYHGYGLVINGYSIIGTNCTLRQAVTIGNKMNRNGDISSAPVIGNNVEFGASSMAIGNITISDGVRIGAGTVVTKNVSKNMTVVSQKPIEW